MIPTHDEIHPIALELLKDGREKTPKEFENLIAHYFNLTEEETLRMYDSGNGPIFRDRISWALSYLNLAGLVFRPKRAVYQISEQGLNMLARPNEISDYVRQKLRERDEQRQQIQISNQENLTELTDQDNELTPQEKLYQSYNKIRQSTYEDLLDTILSKSPREFENIVVLLLQRMGYGDEIKEAGAVTQYSHDGGIDGIIKEDVLGLGRIHIQAKRYSRNNSVGREEIQKFVGALAVAQSNKGVFITTSFYSKGAIEYAHSLQGTTTLVLIDGQQLAQYIYDYSLGMQTEQIIEVKKMDSDFWDSLQEANTVRCEKIIN